MIAACTRETLSLRAGQSHQFLPDRNILKIYRFVIARFYKLPVTRYDYNHSCAP
jgi:hypothetical protein